MNAPLLLLMVTTPLAVALGPWNNEGILCDGIDQGHVAGIDSTRAPSPVKAQYYSGEEQQKYATCRRTSDDRGEVGIRMFHDR
ncbi:hypothetical protein PENSPDRAFT_647179 [Peniophora sp. CONT]|nr:hypothetical protein PENSPDRAFT_647179 [Peniophora sp. CONT]